MGRVVQAGPEFWLWGVSAGQMDLTEKEPQDELMLEGWVQCDTGVVLGG